MKSILKNSFSLAVMIFMVAFWTMDQRAWSQEIPKKIWQKADLEAAQSFICAWTKKSESKVIKQCIQLGFDIVDVQADEWVVCKWKGALDQRKLEQLRNDPNVRFIEPNFRVSISPRAGVGNSEKAIAYKPVFTPDNVLTELSKAKRMICAWQPGNSKTAYESIKSLGLKVEDEQNGEWFVCSWNGKLEQKTLDALASNPALRYIEPDEAIGISGRAGATPGSPSTHPSELIEPFVFLPQDPFISKQYGLRNINAPFAWKNIQESPVVVAVCDTGVDYDHEDLNANMWRDSKTGQYGADFIDHKLEFNNGLPVSVPGTDPTDRNFHGTHVAGIIGAVGNNYTGICGVCWRVKIMAVRCLAADGFGTSSTTAKAIEFAVDHGAKVINCSFSRSGDPLQVELDAIKKARDKGAIVVCAAGNDGQDNSMHSQFPANYTQLVDNMVVVANTDSKNKLHSSSNFSKSLVHLAAPGTAIESTLPMMRTVGYAIEEESARKNGIKIAFPTKYGELTGTSMSAPCVSGAIALMLGDPKNPQLQSETPANIKAKLFKAVRPLPELTDKVQTGGVLDLSFLGEQASLPQLPPYTVTPTPVVICPQKPPCVVVCPPAYECPQQPYRQWSH